MVIDNVRFCDTLDCTPNPTLEGDFDGSGSVDAADYVVWRQGLGSTFTPEDYDAWRADFGLSAGSGASLSGPLSAAVPEPATLLMLILAAIVWLLQPHRHG
jgi:hypothetical protein